MKLRTALVVLLAVVVVGCAGDTGEEAETATPDEPAAPAEPAGDPEAAFEEVRAEYVRHYNLGHPEMVADLHTDDTLFLYADGSVAEGRDELVARLTADMEGSPTLGLETAETLVVGDVILGRGSWTLEVTPEGGDPISQSGSWVNLVERVDGEWRIALVTNNNAAPAPPGTPADPEPETPPETTDTNEALAALAADYATHFNMGHASMVADFFTEDGVAMYAESEPVQGREAITAALEATIAEGSPQLAIHQTGVKEIGEGWFVTIGWYETEATMEGETVRRQGNYTTVAQPTEDGGFLIRWGISNAPNTGM